MYAHDRQAREVRRRRTVHVVADEIDIQPGYPALLAELVGPCRLRSAHLTTVSDQESVSLG
jgi:hypothetical protein